MTPAVLKSRPLPVHYPDPDRRTTGPLTISPRMREVRVDGMPVTLTRMLFDILLLLASRPGWVFPRDRIVQAVRGPNHVVCRRAIDVHIVNIRGPLVHAGHLIETVRGIGYRISAH